MDYKDIIAKTMDMECKARDYYQDLAKKSIEKYSKTTLERLAAEEATHVQIIQDFATAMAKGQHSIAIPDIKQNNQIWENFEASLSELKTGVFSHTDEMSVVKQGIKLEQNGYATYKKAYEQAQDTMAKDLFKFLMEEEVRHERILTMLFDRLTVLYEEDPNARPAL